MRVIILNGPMGVGKTVVGSKIAEQNAGTAFIDGDWCLDLHPFVGNDETKAMAVDNILHMIKNYLHCSACRMIVLVWLMDDEWVRRRISDGVRSMGLEETYVTLICSQEQLLHRWNNDRECKWRTEEWLKVSLKSLKKFRMMENLLDTTALSTDEVVRQILERTE